MHERVENLVDAMDEWVAYLKRGGKGLKPEDVDALSAAGSKLHEQAEETKKLIHSEA